MKAIAYGSLVLSSLLMLLWPVAAYATIFLFDAPTGGTYLEVKRYALVLGILSYPWGYLVGIARILARKHGRVWWTKLTMFFFLTPFLHLTLVFLLAVAMRRRI
jgi:hypothetical protein